MYPEMTVLKTSVSTFNLLIGLGIITALLLWEYRFPKRMSKYRADNILVITVISAFIGFVCAMLSDKLFHIKQQSFTLQYTGMTFLGGLAGGTAAFLVIYKIIFHNDKRLGEAADCLLPCLVIAHGLGRVGCFLGGCCYGRPSLVFGVYYPPGSPAFLEYGGVKVLPIPIFEALFLILLFFAMLYLIKSHLIIWYLISYGVFRFIIEFFRGDDRGGIFFACLSPSQYLAMGMVLIGTGLWIREKRAAHRQQRL